MNIEDRVAFEQAYASGVALATDEQLSGFLDLYISDSNCPAALARSEIAFQAYPDCASSIVDALCVWDNAMQYAKGKTFWREIARKIFG